MYQFSLTETQLTLIRSTLCFRWEMVRQRRKKSDSALLMAEANQLDALISFLTSVQGGAPLLNL